MFLSPYLHILVVHFYPGEPNDAIAHHRHDDHWAGGSGSDVLNDRLLASLFLSPSWRQCLRTWGCQDDDGETRVAFSVRLCGPFS